MSAPFALFVLLLARPQGAPPELVPTPAGPAAASTDGLPVFLAALEVIQGEKSERVALFDDGTIAQAVRVGEAPAAVRRKKISPEEKAVLSRVIAAALDSGEMSKGAPTLLVDQSRRRMVIEVARPEGDSLRFEFGDLSQLSLALGRARGALEDLFERFRETRPSDKERSWSASAVKEGDLLRRRGDRMSFRVVRDDTLSRFLELEESGRRLERMKVSRKDLTKFFLEPSNEPEAERP